MKNRMKILPKSFLLLMKFDITKTPAMYPLPKQHGNCFPSQWSNANPLLNGLKFIKKVVIHSTTTRGITKPEDNLRKEKSTKLIAHFSAIQKDQSARNILYVRFRNYLMWDKAKREWKPRKIYSVGGKASENYDSSKPLTSVVGRMYNIISREKQRVFLLILLSHKSSATSFANLRVHEGIQNSTFREACSALGLPLDDPEWMRFVQDAFSSNFDSLIDIFAIIMAFCEPTNLVPIWKETKDLMGIDFCQRHARMVFEADRIEDYVLTEIQSSLVGTSPGLTLEFLNISVPSRFDLRLKFLLMILFIILKVRNNFGEHENI